MSYMPDSLRGQLASVQKRLWLVETLVAVFGAVSVLLGSYLCVFVLDRFYDTSRLVRFVLVASGLVGAIGCVGWWMVRWPARQNMRALARLVQRRFPVLGDRLLGIVELSEVDPLEPDVSAGLVRAAAMQLAAEARTLDFSAAVPTAGLRRWAVWAGVAVCLTLGVWCAAPQAALSSLLRWLWPGGFVERFTFTRLEKVGPLRVVAYGEEFVVEVRLRADSRWAPRWGRARLVGQPPVLAGLDGGGYRFRLPGLSRPCRLMVCVGDARQWMMVEPVLRPEVVALTAEVQVPSYLGYPAQLVDARKGSVELVEGSAVSFSGRVSRALREVRVLHGAEEAANVGGDSFTTGCLGLRGQTNVVFVWRDQFGLQGRQPFSVRLDWRPDVPPVADFQGLRRAVAMLEDEVLEVELVAEDDFGIKEVSIAWELADLAVGGAGPKQGWYAVGSGAPQLRRVRQKAEFAPRTLGIGPGRVTLRAAAVDYHPGRTPAMSPPYTVFVLSHEDHVKLLEQVLEKVVSKLEEAVRTEEAQADTTRRIRQLSDEELGGAKTTQEIHQHGDAERANRALVEELARELDKLSEEAMRNRAVSARQLKEWTELVEMLRGVAGHELQRAVQFLQGAEQARQLQQRRSELVRAENEQEGALRKLKDALGRLNRSGEQLAAENFVNRLLYCARAENRIGRNVAELLPKTVGMRAEDLSAELLAKVRGEESQQRDVQRRVKLIGQDMEYYLRRVQDPAVKKVYEEIEQKNAADQLGGIAEVIRANRMARAIEEIAHWEKQLLAWAEILRKSGMAGGGRGGGNGISPEMLELLVNLMRIRQQEEQLREQTRRLDASKEQNPLYDEQAERLARWQAELRDRTVALAEEVKLPGPVKKQLDPFFDAVVGAMADARQLLAKPETGGDTIAAETEVIELLASTIQQAEASGGVGSGDFRMRELMRMLQQLAAGEQSGQQGGGSWSGGDTERVVTPSGGDAGARRGQRRVERIAGQDSGLWPAEFRDALEGYFKALEVGDR